MKLITVTTAITLAMMSANICSGPVLPTWQRPSPSAWPRRWLLGPRGSGTEIPQFHTDQSVSQPVHISRGTPEWGTQRPQRAPPPSGSILLPNELHMFFCVFLFVFGGMVSKWFRASELQTIAYCHLTHKATEAQTG